jgi:hypothetical protein
MAGQARGGQVGAELVSSPLSKPATASGLGRPKVLIDLGVDPPLGALPKLRSEIAGGVPSRSRFAGVGDEPVGAVLGRWKGEHVRRNEKSFLREHAIHPRRPHGCCRCPAHRSSPGARSRWSARSGNGVASRGSSGELGARELIRTPGLAKRRQGGGALHRSCPSPAAPAVKAEPSRTSVFRRRIFVAGSVANLPQWPQALAPQRSAIFGGPAKNRCAEGQARLSRLWATCGQARRRRSVHGSASSAPGWGAADLGPQAGDGAGDEQRLSVRTSGGGAASRWRRGGAEPRPHQHRDCLRDLPLGIIFRNCPGFRFPSRARSILVFVGGAENALPSLKYGVRQRSRRSPNIASTACSPSAPPRGFGLGHEKPDAFPAPWGGALRAGACARAPRVLPGAGDRRARECPL